MGDVCVCLSLCVWVVKDRQGLCKEGGGQSA